MKEYQLDLAILEPVGIALVAVPAGDVIEVDMRLESVTEGVLLSAQIFAIAKGELKVKPSDPKIWFTSMRIDCKYTPISYTTMTIDIEKQIEELYNQKNERTYVEKLTFRGYLYQFRKFLESDERFNIISKQTSILTPFDYMQELNASHLNFNINGAGEVCNRDIEIMGLGTALFRTKLVAKFHNELIPNYHYISVDFDNIDYDEHKHDYNGYWKELSENVYDRFQEVKKDKDFIDFVANNGRQWYLENGTIDANVNIILNLLDFKKLK
jgi:hypothetical protein